MPASTSPLPPRERPGLPVGFTRTRPSGAATTVRAPLSTTTAFHACAYRRAVPSRSALICDADRPVSRAISPGWGVTISSPAGCGKVAFSASSRAAAFRPSASSTALPAKPGKSCCTRACVSAARAALWAVPPRPGPSSRTVAFCRRSSGTFSGEIPPSALALQGHRQHSGRRAAAALTTGSTLARVTMPAPVRNAPSAASSAAPR